MRSAVLLRPRPACLLVLLLALILSPAWPADADARRLGFPISELIDGGVFDPEIPTQAGTLGFHPGAPRASASTRGRTRGARWST